MIDNLNYYRVFLAVADTGSISHAAEKLYISQPAVSKSIRNLEEALSVRLIERSSRGIRLTEQGKLLYEHLQEAFQNIHAAEEELRQANDLGIGEIRIGASTSLCRNILLSYLSDFITKYPHIKVSITCHSTLTTVRQLEEGRIDLGLICETTLPERLTYQALQEIHDTFVVNPAYLEHFYVREQAAEHTPDNPWLLAGNVTSLLRTESDRHTKKRGSGSDRPETSGHTDTDLFLPPDMPVAEILERCNLMLLERGNVTRNHLEHFFFQQNIQPGQVLDVNNMDLLIDFAKIGMGVSSVVKEFAQDALSDGSLVELPMPVSVPPRTVGFCYSQQRHSNPSLKKFLELRR
ncbi:MAG: LysR family transcriptional regulator [Eubacterium sp.]|nr:LysR family transcriptional regulator [Eubacterium sp.]